MEGYIHTGAGAESGGRWGGLFEEGHFHAWEEGYIQREVSGLWGKEQGGAEGDICVGGDGATGDSEVTNRDGGGAEENVGIRLEGSGEGGREGGGRGSWLGSYVQISLYLCEVHMATDIPITNYLPQ